MKEDPKFWDKIAERYSRQPIADQETYEKKLSLTRNYLTPDSKVFEFGCGTGSTALLHASYVGEMVATDFSQGMIDIAREKIADGEIKNVRFECSTVFSDEWQPGSFDAVLGLNVLHLMPDYRAAIQRSRELLVDGGVFVTTTPCLAELSVLFRPLLSLGGLFGLIPQLTYFSRDDLENEIRASGFEIVEKLEPAKTARGVFLVARKVG